MMNNGFKSSKQGGFIATILFVIIVLIVLGYFGFNIKKIVDAPVVKDNLNYAWNLVVEVWEKVFLTPAKFIWNKIIIELIWNNFQTLVAKIKN